VKSNVQAWSNVDEPSEFARGYGEFVEFMAKYKPKIRPG